MKKIFIAFALLTASTTTHLQAQMESPVYRQFYFNPYLLNPGFIGASNQTELNMFYKKQSMGISDSPSMLGIAMQVPAGDRVTVGLNVTSDKQVILQNTAITGTFGYLVPLGKEHSLRFALSAGIGMHRFDFTTAELNSNDPAILKASGTRLAMQGNFGVVYQIKALKLGFALTELFQSDPFDDQAHNSFSIRSLKNRLFSASYRFDLDAFQNFQMEPYLLYNQTIDGNQDYFEGAAVFYYRKKIWSGASYNDRHNMALHFGTKLLKTLEFSYSYEFPPMGAGSLVSNSHELHLRLALGKRKKHSGYNPSRGKQ